MYLPALNVTEFLLNYPENDFGEALATATLMVRSEGLLVPPLTFVVTVKNVFVPIGDVELFDATEPLLPFEVEEDEHVGSGFKDDGITFC